MEERPCGFIDEINTQSPGLDYGVQVTKDLGQEHRTLVEMYES